MTFISSTPFVLAAVAVVTLSILFLRARARSRRIAPDVPRSDHRRTLLKTGLGAAGVLVAGASPAVAAAAKDLNAAADQKGAKSLHLDGVDWNRRDTDEGPMTYGRFVATDGSSVGSFHSAALPASNPFAGGSRTVEFHTFDLNDGVLYGVGSQSDPESGSFALLGGTGAYSGATGSYTSLQYPRSFGGDGTASFDITFKK